MTTIKKILFLLNKREKELLLLLAGFSILISIIETIGITSIMPFIGMVTDFSVIHSNKYYHEIYQRLGFSSDIDFIVASGVALVLFYVGRAGLNLLYFHLMARFAQGRYYVTATRLFQKYLSFRYLDFVEKNTATLTKSIVTEAVFFGGIISSILLIVSEMFMIVFLYATMLWVNLKITLISTLVLSIKILFLTQFISKRLKNLGIVRVKASDNMFKVVGSAFGNFKLIKLQGVRPFVQQEYEHATHMCAKANITSATFASFPRLFLETSGFGLLILMTVFVVWKQHGDISSFVPSITLFVLALYRLLPSVNRIMTAYNSILYNYKSMDIIWEDLSYQGEVLGDEILEFNREIKVSGVSFSYNSNTEVLRNINLTIHKGEKVAFKGKSGAGKSTLVDLIIGLYLPTKGNITVDGRPLNGGNLKNWRARCGYIPQQVYLFDGTVAENVVFGRDYDEKRLIETLKQANIYEFLQTKNGLDTRVGEGGIQVSGGQKQRIAIARALYGKPELLILDEATSALDNETESKIMDEIYSLSEDKTLIIIAHRLSTISRCDKVYEIFQGELAL